MARNKGFDIDLTIDKAIRVFRDKGYEGASIQDLVHGLGLSRSSIYETFGSKQDLYKVSLMRYALQSEERIKAILYEDGTARELLIRFFTQILEDNRELTCLLVNATLEMSGHEEFERQVRESSGTNEEGFRQLLVRASARGELIDGMDISVLAKYLVNVQYGLNLSAVSYDSNAIKQIMDASLYFLK